MSFFNTPSLASATATRVDSACKHIQQCRVSYDHMIDFVGSAAELERNKMQYCVHKDEMAVGVSRPWKRRRVIKSLGVSAYPKIVSNLGDITFWLEQEVYRLGVEVRLGTYMEAEDIRAVGAGVVIIATGSMARMDGHQIANPGQPARGVDRSHVVSSVDLFSAPRDLGRTALVLLR